LFSLILWWIHWQVVFEESIFPELALEKLKKSNEIVQIFDSVIDSQVSDFRVMSFEETSGTQFVAEDRGREEPPFSNDPDLEEDDLWMVIRDFFETHGFAQHQLSSYDEFVENGIHSILETNRQMVVGVKALAEEKQLRKLLIKKLERKFDAWLLHSNNPWPLSEFGKSTGTHLDKMIRKLFSERPSIPSEVAELFPDRSSETPSVPLDLFKVYMDLCRLGDSEFLLRDVLGGTESLKGFFEEHPCLYIKNGALMKKYIVEFGELIIEDPCHGEVSGISRKITPFECLSRDITYQSQIFIDLETTDFNGHVNRYYRIPLGSIPVMVGSVLCNLRNIMYDKEKLAALKEDFYDPGGYFIIKGGSKVIASQERTAHNQAYVFKNRKRNPKYSLYTEVRSRSPNCSRSTTTQVGILKDGLISVTVPYIDSAAIPLGVMFRALGVATESDDEGQRLREDCREMVSYILPDFEDREALQILTRTLEYSLEYTDTDTSLYFIGKRGKKFSRPRKASEASEDAKSVRENAISYARHLLSAEFLPHLGSGKESLVKKRFYLGHMVQKLLWVLLGRAPLQDRDHFANKRIATAGTLLCQQFDNAFRRLRNEISTAIERAVQKGSSSIKVTSHIGPKTITNALNGALSDNSWGVRGKNQGVSQKFDHFNFVDALASLRKLVTPISQEGGKIDAPRKLHSSQWSAVCLAETPEGKKVGLVKQLALGGLVSVGSRPESVLGLLSQMKIISFEEVIRAKGKLLKLVKVFVNGDPIGVTRYPEDITKGLRLLRRRGNLNPEVSISFDPQQGEIRVLTEAGRICRPLLIVEKGRVLLRKSHMEKINQGEWDEPSVWTNLIARGFIELIDKAEEENLLVAFSPRDLDGMKIDLRLKYTHCELHPSLIFGVGASTVPYPNYNQSPRNTYQSAMSKQAIGIPGSNYRFRTHGKFHAMDYPQKPLVLSRAGRLIGFDAMPAGQNAIVAVCPWQGFGQEDSIIMNQDSIDRGFMTITTYLCYETKVDKRRSQAQFEVPREEEASRFKGNTSKLILKELEIGGTEKTYCYVPRGTKVEQGDVLIGKTITEDETATIHRKKKTDESVVYDHMWPGTVHSVLPGVDGNGYDYIRIVVAQKRPPVFGDKFCFSLDHEVLTDRGWVPIKDVTKDHRVASLHEGTLVYENPTEIVSFEAPEKMVEIDSNQVSFCVTPNHNMYVKLRGRKQFELRRADTLFDRHAHYKKNAEWSSGGLKEFILPAVWYKNTKNNATIFGARKLPIDPWLNFFGIWIAEGWVRENREVGIAVNKERVRKPLQKSLDLLNIVYVLSKDQLKINIYDKQLVRYMTRFSGGALKKFLPKWVWKLSQTQSQLLLAAMLLGDGHMNGKTPMYDTSSVRLKDDTMKLALHCGWAANAYVRYPKGRHKIIRGRDSVTNADSWRITIVKRQLEPAVNKHIKGQQKWAVPPGKRVYCCTVPSGLLYVRRIFEDKKVSQRPSWVGNSARHGGL